MERHGIFKDSVQKMTLLIALDTLCSHKYVFTTNGLDLTSVLSERQVRRTYRPWYRYDRISSTEPRSSCFVFTVNLNGSCAFIKYSVVATNKMFNKWSVVFNTLVAYRQTRSITLCLCQHMWTDKRVSCFLFVCFILPREHFR